MDKDLVSIIMPAYNAEKYIREAIDSVINQTYTNWELIIVNDGSIDLTSELIKEITISNPKISYYYQQNGRQGKARNLGIQKSKGVFLAFLDADDIWTNDKLAIELDAINKQKNIDLIFSQGYNLSNNKVTECNLLVKEIWDIDDFEKFLHHNQIPILSVLVKKDAVSFVNNFSEQIEIQNAEDYHLWLKLILHNFQFKSISNRLFYYRIHETQATFENRNLTEPIFYSYLDIYQFITSRSIQKALITKLRWYVFNEKIYDKLIGFIIHHFKNTGHKLLASVFRRFGKSDRILQKKIAFHLISRFG